jgi:hypothetical protein
MAKPFTPLLTATPTSPPTYNVGMAETFSWVPVQGADRDLFARSVYLVNPEEIVTSTTSVGSEITTLNSNLTAFKEQELINNNLQFQQLTAFRSQENANDVNLYNRIATFSSHVSSDSSTVVNQLSALTEKINYLVDKANQQLGQKGFDFIEAGSVALGNWTTITVVSAAKFISLGAPNTNTGNLSNYILPITFTFSGPITSINLQFGAVIAYK